MAVTLMQQEMTYLHPRSKLLFKQEKDSIITFSDLKIMLPLMLADIPWNTFEPTMTTYQT